MSYTITNTKSGILHVEYRLGSITLKAGGSTTMDYLPVEIIDRATAGDLSISPSPITEIVDSTGGDSSVSGTTATLSTITVSDVTIDSTAYSLADGAAVLSNMATLAAVTQALNARIAALEARWSY